MRRDRWFKIIYLSVSLLAFYYIGIKICSFEHWDDISAGLLSTNWIILVAIQLILWFTNVGLEAGRWKYFLSPFSYYSFSGSLKMIFSAFSAGSFTPMKLGEHGGRLIFLKNEDRTTGALASVFGSYLNTIVILLFAVVALPGAAAKRYLELEMLKGVNDIFYYFVAAAVLIISLFFFLYFMHVLKRKLRNTRWVLKKEFFLNMGLKRVLSLFLFTSARVFVYNLQLFVWFRFFNINCPVDTFIFLSPLYFAIITLVPGMLLVDLGIRGSAGLFIFSQKCGEPTAILFALFALWIVNVAVPVAIGNVILIFKNHHT